MGLYGPKNRPTSSAGWLRAVRAAHSLIEDPRFSPSPGSAGPSPELAASNRAVSRPLSGHLLKKRPNLAKNALSLPLGSSSSLLPFPLYPYSLNTLIIPTLSLSRSFLPLLLVLYFSFFILYISSHPSTGPPSTVPGVSIILLFRAFSAYFSSEFCANVAFFDRKNRAFVGNFAPSLPKNRG